MNINFPEADVFGNIVTMGLASRRHIGKKPNLSNSVRRKKLQSTSMPVLTLRVPCQLLHSFTEVSRFRENKQDPVVFVTKTFFQMLAKQVFIKIHFPSSVLIITAPAAICKVCPNEHVFIDNAENGNQPWI